MTSPHLIEGRTVWHAPTRSYREIITVDGDLLLLRDRLSPEGFILSHTGEVRDGEPPEDDSADPDAGSWPMVEHAPPALYRGSKRSKR